MYTHTLSPRRRAGTYEQDGNDSGREVEIGAGGGVGGGRGEEGGGREVERAAGTAERKEGAGLDEYLCSVPAGYGSERKEDDTYNT